MGSLVLGPGNCAIGDSGSIAGLSEATDRAIVNLPFGAPGVPYTVEARSASVPTGIAYVVLR